MTARLTVIAVTAAEPNLRGLLTKWLIEPVPGTYCGLLTPRVRDALWTATRDSIAATNAHAALIHQHDNQIAIETCGDRPRRPLDLEGLTLIAWSMSDPAPPEVAHNPPKPRSRYGNDTQAPTANPESSPRTRG